MTVRLGVCVWHPGDVIPLGGRSLPVVSVRNDGEDDPTVLVVEDSPATN